MYDLVIENARICDGTLRNPIAIFNTFAFFSQPKAESTEYLTADAVLQDT